MAELITLARPYAQAAFATAKEDGALAQWSETLALAARIAADPQVAEYVLGNPVVEPEAAAEFFVQSTKADGKLANLLALMADNGRLALLPQMVDLFLQLRAKEEQTLAVTVTSASVFTDEQLENLKRSLKQRFGRDVTLDVEVDESLLGGAIIHAGDTVIDGTLRSKLSRLNTALAH